MRTVWDESFDKAEAHGPLSENIKTDVLIIGGGIAGVLCAYRLRQAGARCTVIEGGRMLCGCTRGTTAKITAQHNLIYDKLIKRFGEEKARMYYDVNTAAIGEYKRLAANIPCDLEEKTAYVYTTSSEEKLSREAEAYQKLGIPFVWKKNIPLPVDALGAIGMPHQAQYNPIMLLKGLLPRVEYYEDTFAENIDGGRVYTKNGRVTAEHIIIATRYPMINIQGLYFMKLTQSRSYVLALEGGPDIDGMYIDEGKNGYSFRNYKDMLFIGNVGHKTGKTGADMQHLKQFAAVSYPRLPVKYAWAAQDCVPVDDVPYIGRITGGRDNIYVATGFNKWGMTSAMAASKILSELILYGRSDAEELFSPQRSMLRPRLAANIFSAAAGLIRPGRRCTHMGCSLVWNKEEKTWDCPCHGSRFDRGGNVIEGPAKKCKNMKGR